MGSCVPVVVVAIFLAGCGGATAQGPIETSSPAQAAPATATTATPAKPEPFGEALAHARALRADALAAAAPTLAPPATKERARAFVEQEAKDWFASTSPRVAQADEAYARAWGAATTAEERATAAAEVAELDVTFAERFVNIGLSGMPDEWRRDRSLRAAYEVSIRSSAKPWVDRARTAATKCAENPNETHCTQTVARIATLERAAAAASSVAAEPASGPPPPAGCPHGDPLCTPARRKEAPRGPAGKCRCAPTDPLCSCL